MNKYFFIVLSFFIFTNVVAFLMMWIDKGMANKKGSQRISEGMIFFIATIFGSIGVYLGMFIFRHKTRKWYFIVGIPFIILQNIVFLLMIYFLVTGKFIV
ncbi:MAG TPA: DUF1294 domain-containing protein [Candidatus Pacebacteria bacterium]|nr:DUF1294 domain-containing protein [Candidatus Paceibacterota bacterium]